jgi:catechol 2,3-dioxygenase-like lactoylglutathione lyase family enzyme
VSDDGPVLNQLNLIAADLAATAAFYRLLGVAVPEPSGPWAADHMTVALPNGFGLDFDSVSFAAEWDQGWPGSTGAVIGFRLPSREAVDALFDKMTAAGYRPQQPPYDASWGARYAVIEDPDGRAVGLMSPIPPRG